MSEKAPEIELQQLEEGTGGAPLPTEPLVAPLPSQDPHPVDQVDPVPNSDRFSRFLIGVAYFFLTITAPISVWFCVVVINEFERGVWLRLGRLRFAKPVEPGVHIRLPFIDEVIPVDMRVKTLNVVPQAILSHDSVTVTVDAVIYTRVVDPLASVLNVAREKYATELLGQTTLRNILGTKSLAAILSEREAIARQMRDILDDATDRWGVKVERVEVKDVSLPPSMQRSMAAIAEAEREAKARIIAAESEQAASVALKKAAIELADSPAALQLRYLQTLNTISAEHSSTIVFPFPIDMLKLFNKA